MSFIERITFNYLEKNNYLIKKEKTFDDLYNFKNLRYDFFLRDLNCLIEVDGQQHFYYPNEFYKNRNDIKIQILTDIKKNFYAIKNGFNFLRISYIETDHIDTILDTFINLVKRTEKQIIMYSNPKLYKSTYLFTNLYNPEKCRIYHDFFNKRKIEKQKIEEEKYKRELKKFLEDYMDFEDYENNYRKKFDLYKKMYEKEYEIYIKNKIYSTNLNYKLEYVKISKKPQIKDLLNENCDFEKCNYIYEKYFERQIKYKMNYIMKREEILKRKEKKLREKEEELLNKEKFLLKKEEEKEETIKNINKSIDFNILDKKQKEDLKKIEYLKRNEKEIRRNIYEKARNTAKLNNKSIIIS